MSNADQLQSVQQQVADVVRQVADFEASRIAAELAGGGDKVSFLRSRLLQLGEEETLLLRAQPRVEMVEAETDDIPAKTNMVPKNQHE